MWSSSAAPSYDGRRGSAALRSLRDPSGLGAEARRSRLPEMRKLGFKPSRVIDEDTYNASSLNDHFSYLFSHKALEPEAEFAEVAEDTGADAETMLRG